LALFENTVQTLVLVEEHIISPLKTGTKLFLIGIFSIALGHLVDFPNNLSQVFSILSRTEVAAGAPCSGQAPKHALVRAIARGVDATLGIRRDGCYWRSHRWFFYGFPGFKSGKAQVSRPKNEQNHCYWIYWDMMPQPHAWPVLLGFSADFRPV